MARRSMTTRYSSNENLIGDQPWGGQRAKTYDSIGRQRDDLLRNSNITPARAQRVRAAASRYRANILASDDYQRSRRRTSASTARSMVGFSRTEYDTPRRVSARTRARRLAQGRPAYTYPSMNLSDEARERMRARFAQNIRTASLRNVRRNENNRVSRRTATEQGMSAT